MKGFVPVRARIMRSISVLGSSRWLFSPLRSQPCSASHSGTTATFSPMGAKVPRSSSMPHTGSVLVQPQ